MTSETLLNRVFYGYIRCMELKDAMPFISSLIAFCGGLWIAKVSFKLNAERADKAERSRKAQECYVYFICK